MDICKQTDQFVSEVLYQDAGILNLGLEEKREEKIIENDSGGILPVLSGIDHCLCRQQ